MHKRGVGYIVDGGICIHGALVVAFWPWSSFNEFRAILGRTLHKKITSVIPLDPI